MKEIAVELSTAEQVSRRGNEAALQALVQNAQDAVVAREALDPAFGDGEVVVTLDRDGDSWFLEVHDNGVGMDDSVVLDSLLAVGSSGWGRHWGIQVAVPDGLGPGRRFGVGFYGVFALGEEVTVTTRRYDLGPGVRYLVGETGVRQLLDLGCGIPTHDTTHQIAQRVAPETRVVYVDHDPVVLARSHQLLRSTPEGDTAFLLGDLRQPHEILDAAAETLDFTEPVGVLLCGVLHYLSDEADPSGIVAQLLDAVPSHSPLVISHLASDLATEMVDAADRHNCARVQDRLMLRSREEVAVFVDGLELVEPGLVEPDRWHPDLGNQPSPQEAVAPAHAAVAHA